MSETLTIYLTDHGRVGHSYIGLTDSKGHTEYWGYYPEAALSGTEKNGPLSFVENFAERLYGPGKLAPDIKTFEENSKISSDPIRLTDAQYQNVQDYLHGLERQPGDYSVIGRNCVDIANGALAAAGQSKDIGDLFDLQQLSEASKAGLYTNVMYVDHFIANPTGQIPAADHVFSKGEWATGQPQHNASDHSVLSPAPLPASLRDSVDGPGPLLDALKTEVIANTVYDARQRESEKLASELTGTTHREPLTSILGSELYHAPKDAGPVKEDIVPGRDIIDDALDKAKDVLGPILNTPINGPDPRPDPIIIENASPELTQNTAPRTSAESEAGGQSVNQSLNQGVQTGDKETRTDSIAAPWEGTNASPNDSGAYATYQPKIPVLEPIPFDEGTKSQPVELTEVNAGSPYNELLGVNSGVIVDPVQGPEPTGRDFIDPYTQRDDLQVIINSTGLSPLPEPTRPEPAPEPVVISEPMPPVIEGATVTEPAPPPQETIQLAPLPVVNAPVESPSPAPAEPIQNLWDQLAPLPQLSGPATSPPAVTEPAPPPPVVDNQFSQPANPEPVWNPVAAAPAQDSTPSLWDRLVSQPQTNDPNGSQQPVFQPQATDTTPPLWGSTSSPAPAPEHHEKSLFETLFDAKPSDPTPGSWVETTAPQQNDPAPRSWVETVAPPEQTAPAPSSWVEAVSTPPAPAPEPAPPAPEPAPAPSHDSWVGSVTDNSPAPAPAPSSDPGPSPSPSSSGGGMGI